MRNQLKSDPTVKCRHVSVSITDLTTAPWGLKFCLWKCASSLTWREFTGERFRFSWCCFFCSGSFSWRAARRLPAEDGHHNIFRNQRVRERERERERQHSFLARSPQQASICLPLRERSTRSALRPWDLRAVCIRKWGSAKRRSAAWEGLGWMTSSCTQRRDTTDDGNTNNNVVVGLLHARRLTMIRV